MSCYQKCHVCNGKGRDENRVICCYCDGKGKVENCDMVYVNDSRRLWSKIPPWVSVYKCKKCGRVEYDDNKGRILKENKRLD